jgi:MoaA/NifB/PqqE/SkfB family radical SAM enzyme
VITGGDPLKRPDLLESIAFAKGLDLWVGVTPAATPLLTEVAIDAMGEAGADMVALSLDGPDAARHDGFRGMRGSFERTLTAAMYLKEAGIPLQINTTVTSQTAPDLPAVAERVAELGAVRWSVFFLVPVGRGRLLKSVSAGESERLCQWLLDAGRQAPFQIKTTEAPHIRRLAIQRLLRAGRSADDIERMPLARAFGVRDGNGVMFVSSRGEIHPSGFLALPAGRVGEAPLGRTYREHPLFRALRDPSAFHGRCGRCQFREVCGGSRARACAASGDPLGEDPLCPFVPAGVV